MNNKREFKPRRRTSAFRDASLIVIATEGAKTETKYFKDFISSKFYKNQRVHVEVVKKASHKSAPVHVIKALDNFRSEYSLRAYDELWMVIDVDKWPEKQLSDVAQKCRQKGYKLAVSNPCFELWLLLHVQDVNEYDSDFISELEANNKVNQNTTLLENVLSDILGGYNKSNPETDKFLPYVELAISRARELDEKPDQR